MGYMPGELGGTLPPPCEVATEGKKRGLAVVRTVKIRPKNGRGD